MKQQIALITGTSNGFGKLTAITLANKGIKVYAGMRNMATKNATAAAELNAMDNITAIELDVTNETAVQAAIANVEKEAGTIDILVNNAGVVGMGLVEQFTTKEIQAIFDTNFFGLLNVTRAVLPVMRKNKSGLVINISSGLGRITMPFNGVYGASKYAVEAISQALRYELTMVGVDMVVIEPGAFPSTNAMHAGVQFNAANNQIATAYGELAVKFPTMMAGMFQQMVANGYAPNPQMVADIVWEAIEIDADKRPLRIVADPQNKGKLDELNAFNDEMHKDLLNGFKWNFCINN